MKLKQMLDMETEDRGDGGFTLHVRIRTIYRARMWTAMRLISAAAWLLGASLEVEE